MSAWKGFDFILFGTGSQGNDVFCGLNRVDYNLNQLTYFTKNRWTESNRNGKTPASGATDYTKYLTSSGCVFDGSYFKIKQIQLGYSFPKQLIKKVAIEIYVYMAHLRTSLLLQTILVLTLKLPVSEIH